MAAFDLAGPPIVEPLQVDDTDGLWPLSIEAGWNQVAADWRLLLSVGHGWGVRDAKGTWIASAIILPLGASLSWISMLLVTAPARRRGLGIMLLARCVGEIERTGAIAGLDATEYGRPIYLPLGFRDVFPLSRWAAANVARRHVPSAEDIEVGTPVQADLDLILRYDSARSGLQRGAILQDLWARAPGQARIAHRDGTIIGFAMSREGHRAMHIGPVVADDESVGIALASDLLSDTRAPMIIDVPDGHLGFAEWLRSVGASVSRSYVRMLRGSGPDIEGPNCVFALTGPELA